MTSLGARMKGNYELIIWCLQDCQREEIGHTCYYWLLVKNREARFVCKPWLMRGVCMQGLVRWWAHQCWLVGVLVGKYMRFTFWQLRKPGRKNMILANRVWSAPPSPGASCPTWDGQKLSPARPTISSTTTHPITTTTTTTSTTTTKKKQQQHNLCPYTITKRAHACPNAIKTDPDDDNKQVQVSHSWQDSYYIAAVFC